MLTYAHSLSGGYVYEDVRPDAEAVYAETWHGWRGLVAPRSLSRLSFTVTTAVAGASPSVARTVSLAWHLLNGWLLWLVAGRTRLAAVVAGLFLLLPMQTEAVAGIAYRSELVAATWLLCACLAVNRGWALVALGCAVSAFTGKEAGLIALALVPLWAAWTRDRRWGWAVLVGLALVLVAPVCRSVPLLPQSLGSVSRSIAALGHLLALVVWPAGLTIDHDWAALTARQLDAAPLTLGLLAAIALLAWGSRPSWAFAWVLVALAPRLLWDVGEGLHERHLYTPLIGLALACAVRKD